MNDKEGRKWLLQKLYDKGIKYVVFDGVLHNYLGLDCLPERNGNLWRYKDSKVRSITPIQDLLPDFNEPNYLDIGKYLGIVDWSEASVNTPIIINHKSKTLKRYFAKYDGGKVYYFGFGATSWSAVDTHCTESNNVKLAGGDDEK